MKHLFPWPRCALLLGSPVPNMILYCCWGRNVTFCRKMTQQKTKHSLLSQQRAVWKMCQQLFRFDVQVQVHTLPKSPSRIMCHFEILSKHAHNGASCARLAKKKTALLQIGKTSSSSHSTPGLKTAAKIPQVTWVRSFINEGPKKHVNTSNAEICLRKAEWETVQRFWLAHWFFSQNNKVHVCLHCIFTSLIHKSMVAHYLKQLLEVSHLTIHCGRIYGKSANWTWDACKTRSGETRLCQ